MIEAPSKPKKPRARRKPVVRMQDVLSWNFENKEGAFYSGRDEWLRLVEADETLDMLSMVVASKLLRYLNSQSKEAYPSQIAIAKALRKEPRSVERSVQKLVARGWLTTERHKWGGNNRYTLSYSLEVRADIEEYLAEVDRQAELAKAERQAARRQKNLHPTSSSDHTRRVCRVVPDEFVGLTSEIEPLTYREEVTDKESLQEEDTGAREISVPDLKPADPPPPPSDRFRVISDMLTDRISGPPALAAWRQQQSPGHRKKGPEQISEVNAPPARASPFRESGCDPLEPAS